MRVLIGLSIVTVLFCPAFLVSGPMARHWTLGPHHPARRRPPALHFGLLLIIVTLAVTSARIMAAPANHSPVAAFAGLWFVALFFGYLAIKSSMVSSALALLP